MSDAKAMTDERLLFAAYEQTSGARVALHDVWERTSPANAEMLARVVHSLRNALAAAQALEVRARTGRLHF
jgi:hypothetical protein